MYILTKLRKSIDTVLNFENTACVLNKVIIKVFEALLMEHFSVLSSNFKNVAIVGSIVCLIICVSRWPLIKVELKAENFTLQQASHLNSLRCQCCEVSLEDERGNKRVLVFNDIVDNDLNSADLVVF